MKGQREQIYAEYDPVATGGTPARPGARPPAFPKSPSMIAVPQPAEAGLARFDNRADLSRFIAFQNEKAWAMQKALLFPRIDVFYTLIPKNACTTILSALVKANGLTADWFQRANRIHNLQTKFHAFRDLDHFHEETFKIIALRDPLQRLSSAFRDKLVDRRSENINEVQFFEQRLKKPIADCRFSDIVRIADHYAHWALEQHFAPQWSFLFYDRYDLVIDADRPLRSLDIGGQIVPLGWHNRKSIEPADEDIGDATIGEIRAFVARTGKYPRISDARDMVQNIIGADGNIARDLQLYAALEPLPD